MKYWPAVVSATVALAVAIPVVHELAPNFKPFEIARTPDVAAVQAPDANAPPALAGIEIDRMFLGDDRVTAPAAQGRVASLSVRPALQKVAMSSLKARRAANGAVLVMDLRTGRLLAYASRTSGSTKVEPVTSARQPASDVLKLLTLAAAMERSPIAEAARICFRDPGKKLELDDLIEDTERDTWCPTIGEALARNMDAAFARLGYRKLSREALEHTAGAFGFGKTIPFDVDVEPSVLSIPDTEEGLVQASIGSGEATMTALQGLLFASSIATKGVMVKPVLVETVEDDKGKLLYRAPAEPVFLGRPIGVHTAEVLSRMMVDTVEIGTAFRAFHDDTGHPYLRDVKVGGKTGDTLDAKTKRRTTWFVGFAPSEDPQIAIATVAQHSAQSDGTAPVIAVDVLRAYFEVKKEEAGSS